MPSTKRLYWMATPPQGESDEPDDTRTRIFLTRAAAADYAGPKGWVFEVEKVEKGNADI